MLLQQGIRMARGLVQLVERRVAAHLHRQALKLAFQRSPPRLGAPTDRTLTVSPRLFSSAPRDYSLPNDSWSAEMRRLYDQYDQEPGGGGRWKRLPSYNRFLKYATGGQCLSRLVQSRARLFTRNIKEPGAAFEYAIFINEEEKRAVCVFQAGHLLEGPPGHVHGGAIATIIDNVTGACATYISGFVLTANLNINYCSPISLGSVVLVDCAVDRVEGRKTWVSCRITSADGSKLHTEATGLFVSVGVSHLFTG
ncbi:acyl-coenzyme A thioesterase THEM4 isoform X2 [Lepisosteus oculatus]|uniref:acyl-coenzyme A thioesterase THEM4 isoform X2 n=1 Tax=Lepisosteus oculatus TaxID=7918 RepID=UPI00073FF991|nr:PREDICTED: acyl-coenzyme A thioesterase THEM4-like isoform X2 [Lepisosteus oculatus]